MIEPQLKKGRKPKEKRYDTKFAKTLRTLLSEKEENGINLSTVADDLGITRQSLAQYRDGNNIPDIVILGRMAEYFNVSTDFLLGKTEIRSTDNDVKVACKVTGLSEKAVIGIRENVRNLNFPFEKIENERTFKILSEIVLNENFWDLVLSIECLSETSLDELNCSYCIATGEVAKACEILDIEPIFLLDYITKCLNSIEPEEEFINYDERIDMLKYRAFCEVQKLCECFDYSNLKQTFNEEKWLEYLKIDKKTLLELREISAEYRKKCEQKAGD